jgi:hypothetical protein
MKRFSSFSAWLLLIVSALLLILPSHWFPSFYDVRYSGSAALLGALIIRFSPRLFWVNDSAHSADKKNQAVDEFQFLLSIFILSNVAGELGLFRLYRAGFQYDKLLHFGISFISAYRLPNLLNRRFDISFTRAFLVIFAGILLVGVGWELYEFSLDAVLGTHLYGVYGENISTDTWLDLASDLIGIFIGIGLAVAEHKKSAS